MTIRLTTPEAFDRLIDHLEKKHNLAWPVWRWGKKSYRDYFKEIVKKQMKTSTLLLHVDMKYDPQTNRLKSEVGYTALSEVKTDEQYMEEELKRNNDEH